MIKLIVRIHVNTAEAYANAAHIGFLFGYFSTHFVSTHAYATNSRQTTMRIKLFIYNIYLDIDYRILPNKKQTYSHEPVC